jgi:long-chain acyl-CoA synthetase
MTNVVSHLRETVRDHPEEVALSVSGNETTYAQLWAMTGRFAAGLVERGVEPGDPVALYLPNLPQYVAAFHGILRAGGVVVPVNPQYKAREIRHLLTDSGAVAVLTTTDRVSEIESVHAETDIRFIVTADGEAEFSTGFADFIGTDASFDFWELADREDDEVAVLPYTSGTTGDPKGIELTHLNLTSNARASADLVPDGIGTDDAALGALPLFHSYGMTVVLNATLLSGGTFYPMAKWEAGRALELIDEAGITIFHGVPAMYNELFHYPDADEDAMASVRLAGVGGSGIPVEVLRQFEERFGVTIHEGYGLTETSPVTHFNAPEWGRRVGSIGKTLPDVEARVVDEDFETVDPVEEGPVDEDGVAPEVQGDGGEAADEVDLDDICGELVVAGPNVMKGYHDLPEANEAAFTEASGERWFHTGDVAYHDADGYYYIVDRKTDIVVTGGYNVYPREVEELLYEHEGVADAAVVGIPDDSRGETVKAFVVPTGDADLSETAVTEYCLDNLAEYKHPRVVEFVEELPRTSTGKVQKYKLREASESVSAEAEAEDADGETGDEADAEPADADAAVNEDEAEVAEDDAEAGEADDVDAEAKAGATEAKAVAGEAEAGVDDADAETGADDAGAEAGADDAESGVDDAEAAEGGADAEVTSGDGHPGEIEDISGVGPSKGKTLRAAGFESIEDVRTASHEELAAVDGIGDALAEQIKLDVEGDG